MDVKDKFIEAEKLRVAEKLEDAIKAYQLVVDFSDEDVLLKAESLHMIGLVYLQLDKIELAQNSLYEALTLFQQISNELLIGAVYRDLAAVEKKIDMHSKKVEELYLNSISHLGKIANNGHLGISFIRLGDYYLENDRYSEAEEKIGTGFQLVQKSDEEYFKASAYFSYAKLNRYNMALDEAKDCAIQALNILKRLNSHKSKQKEIIDFIGNPY